MYHAAPKIRYTAKLPCRIGVKKDLKRHVSQKPTKKASKSTVCSGDVLYRKHEPSVNQFAYEKIMIPKNAPTIRQERFYWYYSCLIAESALILTARFAGENPDSSPTSVANSIEPIASQNGMIELPPIDVIPIMPPDSPPIPA